MTKIERVFNPRNIEVAIFEQVIYQPENRESKGFATYTLLHIKIVMTTLQSHVARTLYLSF